MRRNFLFVLSFLAVSFLPAKDIYVNTPHTTLLLKAEQGSPLHISYYGESVTDAEQVYRAYSLWEDAYPAFGLGNYDITALSVRHADGNMSTELVFQQDAVATEGRKTSDAIFQHFIDLLGNSAVKHLPVDTVMNVWCRQQGRT